MSGARALAVSLVLLCGLPPATGFAVVGGHNPPPGKWGFAVEVRTPQQLCTGSVLTPTRVLTAAHCTDSPARMSVRAGSRQAGRGGQVLGVQAVTVHPAFSPDLPGNAFLNDLAVLKLAGSAAAPAVPLADDPEDAALTAPGDPLHLAGFGWANPGATGPVRQGRLRAARLRSRKACRRYRDFSAATMLCASGPGFIAGIADRGRKPVARSGCFGDSGGPLIAATAAGPRLVGVLSYGPEYPRRFDDVACGLKGFPDVFMRTASSRAFIEGNL